MADSQQITYYRAHAPNYDIAYLDNDWDQSIEELPITGDVLELACRTGDAGPGPPACPGVAGRIHPTDVFAWEPPRR